MESKEKFDPLKVAQIVSKGEDPADLLSRIKGQQFREYRNRWNQSCAGELVQNYPIHLDMEITGGCNLNCGMCINAVPMDERRFVHRPGGTISLQTFKRILNDGVPRGLSSITLNGNNEPLLCPNIVDYVIAANTAGVMDIMLHTNANLLHLELAKALLDAGLTRIYFSIDAITPETYSQVRIGGDFDKVMQNIHSFLEIKKKKKIRFPITRVSFVETKKNMHERKNFVSYWESIVDFVVVQSYNSPFVDTSVYFEKEGEYRIEDNTRKSSFFRCPQPFQRLFIRNNGDVHPCCTWYGYDMIIGNIYETELSEIFNNQLMTDLRERVNQPQYMQPQSCRRCRTSIIACDSNDAHK